LGQNTAWEPDLLVSLLGKLDSVGIQANAEMAKEGSLSGTVTYAGTHKVIPLVGENFILVYENTGVRVSDSGEGPFHGMSTRNVGVGRSRYAAGNSDNLVLPD
jgi:hypothetical protein